MSCYYSDALLEEWDSVCNPIGELCFRCDNCECDHWAGDHSEYCPNLNPDCLGYDYSDDEGLEIENA